MYQMNHFHNIDLDINHSSKYTRCINEDILNQETPMNLSKNIPFKKLKAVIFSPSFLTYAVFVFVLVTATQGYCDSGTTAGIDSIATDCKNFIFKPWVRMIMLSASGFMGVFKAFTTGSPLPLLSWGLLGFILGYLPKIIDHLSTVGT